MTSERRPVAGGGTPPPAAVSCFSHLGITVADPAASADFYIRVLGFSQLYTDTGEGWTRLGLGIGETVVELFGPRSDGFPQPEVDPFYPMEFGRPKIALTVVDIEDTYRRVTAIGATPLCPITETRVSRFFFIADPDGTPIQLQEFSAGRQRVVELFA
ncbi:MULTISPECIES: VOC family protein [Pseudofrankia]|uniref:VOC family protein n=1 Tax=Pseudofrankia TaxID=2994363 RepID=UPI000234BBD1|nr:MULTISPECIES: VOC family protein [Pseudofrankia]OHV30182.1 hypothetical protein BCD49_34570 [Pseudofrankia sp. EUN1h]